MTDLTNNRIPLNPYDPRELISTVPYQLKFQPAQSLVALTAREGVRGIELGLLAHMNIETLFDPAVAARARTSFMSNLAHQNTWDGFIVLYSDELLTTLSIETRLGSGAERRTALITLELARWYDIEHFHPTRTYVVGRNSWRCLSCSDPGHCTMGGHPTSALSHTRVAAQMVVLGRHFAKSREELIVLPPEPAPGVVNARVEEELRTLQRLDAAPRTSEWKIHMVRNWKSVIHPVGYPQEEDGFNASELCVLALSLHHIPLRDIIIYAICTGNDLPDPGERTETHFAAMFHATGEPDITQMHSALRNLEAMAGNCPGSYRAPILTVWAWCNWWVGNGAEANILVDLALERDEEYSLALTMRKVLGRSLLPPWMKVGRDDH